MLIHTHLAGIEIIILGRLLTAFVLTTTFAASIPLIFILEKCIDCHFIQPLGYLLFFQDRLWMEETILLVNIEKELGESLWLGKLTRDIARLEASGYIESKSSNETTYYRLTPLGFEKISGLRK